MNDKIPPVVGDKIRLTNLDEIGRECGYLPGDEAVIVAIDDDGVVGKGSVGATYVVKFTKLQNQSNHQFHIEEHGDDAEHDYFFEDEFEVVR